VVFEERNHGKATTLHWGLLKMKPTLRLGRGKIERYGVKKLQKPSNEKGHRLWAGGRRRVLKRGVADIGVFRPAGENQQEEAGVHLRRERSSLFEA